MPPVVERIAERELEQQAEAAALLGEATPPDHGEALAIEEEAVAYQPPFPERRRLFEPPRNTNRLKQRSDDESDSVVLMGFANLGDPRVVLAIDGVVTPLASGAEASGVRVISIEPPRAVLQRGRNRWTASIE